VQRQAEGKIPLLAGPHLVRAEQAGHDPQEITVEVAAGAEVAAELRLVPNARTIVLETEPAGVEVKIDGAPAGVTARPETGGPARIVVENLAPGEHTYELTKPCFRSERRRDVLTIDLLDHAPKRYDVVRLVPVASQLVFAGGLPGAEVRIDGEPAGQLPLAPVQVCPGAHRIEVHHGGRAIWVSTEEPAESEVRRIEVVPRPNVVLVGAAGWPERWESALSRYSLREARPAPFAGDPSRVSDWQAIELGPDTDLAIATGSGPDGAWALYSPHLATAARVESVELLARPSWLAPAWGLIAADLDDGGPPIVVEAPAAGAAAAAGISPGARVVTVGGVQVDSAARLRGVLALATADKPLRVEWRAAGGGVRTAELRASRTPRLEGDRPIDGARAIVRAAWAVVDGLCDPERAPAALSNLALLYSGAGRHDRAVETWRRVRWPARPGIGEGTARYYLGRELQLTGQTAAAAEALRAAAASEATAFDDEGPAVAPAARDRLLELE
jgi:hypothetical protein